MQVLPDNLLDSLRQAADATTTAISKGVYRATIEILLPEFWDPSSGAVFAEEGDQMRFWQLSKRFAENLIELTGRTNVTVVRHAHRPIQRIQRIRYISHVTLKVLVLLLYKKILFRSKYPINLL